MPVRADPQDGDRPQTNLSPLKEALENCQVLAVRDSTLAVGGNPLADGARSRQATDCLPPSRLNAPRTTRRCAHQSRPHRDFSSKKKTAARIDHIKAIDRCGRLLRTTTDCSQQFVFSSRNCPFQRASVKRRLAPLPDSRMHLSYCSTHGLTGLECFAETPELSLRSSRLGPQLKTRAATSLALLRDNQPQLFAFAC